MVQKLTHEGKIAVLISEGFGAGWSTWNDEYPDMLFDPEIAQMIEDDKSEDQIMQVAVKTYPKAYLGGLDGLVVKWVVEGTKFIVDEYDGSESLIIQSETDWMVA
jgi:hypothetical protein